MALEETVNIFKKVQIKSAVFGPLAAIVKFTLWPCSTAKEGKKSGFDHLLKVEVSNVLNQPKAVSWGP